MKTIILLACCLVCCWTNDSYGCEWTRARFSQIKPVLVPQFQPSAIAWSYVQQPVVNYVPTVVYQPVVNTQTVAVPVVTYPVYVPVTVVPYYGYGYTVYRY